MGIRLTESRIPADFSPADLGESNQVADGTGLVKYALVSYLTSPIARGSKVDYVVFVLREDLSQADDFRYQWTLTHLPSGDKEEKANDEAVYQYSADRSGDVLVRVEVLRGSTSVTVLTLTQRVEELEPGLEGLLKPTGMLKHLNVDSSVGSLGGNSRTSRELINDFRRYVFAATDPAPPLVGIDLPTRFVAAILYVGIHRMGYLGRRAELAAAAAELNGEWSLARAFAGMENALGIARIKPQTLAMVLERSPGETYTEWTDLPSDPDKRPTVHKTILANLNGLDDAQTVKVDLFNLLRFPKSNILMCARLLRRLVTRPRRWPNATRAQLINNENALAIVATEYQIGGTESLLPPGNEPPGPGEAKANNYGRRVVQSQMRLPALVVYFGDSTSEGAWQYGGYDLRRGDNDGAQLWGGSPRVEPEPASYVESLQEDLDELGFKIVGGADGGFGRRTEWAVREFQIYAQMPNVAADTGTGARYVDGLRQVTTVLPYDGPVSGVVNAATRVALQYWKASRWRCPVVIGAYSAGGNLFNNMDNIWVYNEVGNCSPDVYARDLSGYYGVDQNADLLIGMHAAVGDGPVSLRMNTCNRMREHPVAEVTPELLAGIPAAELSQNNMARQKSTFKVLRSIAQAESVGYFDSVNAWDTAIISIGMYHWTLGLQKSGTSVARGERCVDSMCDGEMCAFLGLLKMTNPEAYDRYFQRFGIDVDRQWWLDGLFPSKGGDPFFMKSLYKYAGWLRLQNDDGDSSDLTRQVSEANYLRNWHWFYRVTMANRQSEAVQRLNWVFTRIRIRDMLRLPWRREDVPAVVPGTEFRLGDIYTSEKATALLLRAHVNYPRTICLDGFVSSGPGSFNVLPFALESAINAAPALDWSQSPQDWGDDEEKEPRLIEHLLATLQARFTALGAGATVPTFGIVAGYEWQGEALSEERNSFRFHGEGLPDEPSYE